jgi:hypothetical protein
MLFARLMGLEQPSIPVHAFMGALGEYSRGTTTAAQIAAHFGLSQAEVDEGAGLFSKIVHPVESISIGGGLVLTNVGAAYDNAVLNISQGLGLVRIHTAGITAIEFGVKVNKIGTGIQSWQLWNETDGTEIAVIDDAGAAGTKNLVTTRNFAAPLGVGVVTARVRAKSTVSGDDPVFLGASLMIQRVARMTADDLHQVLLLAAAGYPTVNTVELLKARIGVA